MLKKLSFIFSIMLLQNGFAETCPNIAHLRNHHFMGWQALNIDNGIPPSSNELEQFTHLVASFALAEWMEDAPEGSGHCYYYGKHPDSNYLHVFLAKRHLIPDNSTYSWQQITPDIAQCHANIDLCQFY